MLGKKPRAMEDPFQSTPFHHSCRAVQHMRTERVLERTRSFGMWPSFSRPTPDNAKCESEEDDDEDGVNANECDQARKERLRGNRRHGVDGSQDAVDDPWLPSSLRDVPAGQCLDNPGRRHKNQHPKKPTRTEESPAESQPQRSNSDCEHDDRQSIHDSKGIKDHTHNRLAIARRIFKAFDTPVETVGQPDASKVRYSQSEAISLIVLVGYYDPVVRRRRLRVLFPEAFSSLHLRRLVLEHGPVNNVSDENLPGY